MKVIIAGSRSFEYGSNDVVKLVADAVMASRFNITEIVSGNAIGVDQAGEHYAKMYQIPCTLFYPDWKTHGKSAGAIRNSEMADYADALIAIWDGKSKGTQHMIKAAKKRGLLVYEHFNYERDETKQLPLFGEL